MQINFIEIAVWHGCSPVNLLHIFSTPFPKNTSGWKKIMHFSPTKIESLLHEGWEVCISLQPHGHFFDITKRASIFLMKPVPLIITFQYTICLSQGSLSENWKLYQFSWYGMKTELALAMACDNLTTWVSLENVSGL